MTDTFKKLAQTVIGLSQEIVVCAPATGQSIIKRYTIANAVCATSWAKLWQSGTANANLILPQIPIVPCGRLDDTGMIMLLCGDMIYAQAQLPSALTITFQGLEII